MGDELGAMCGVDVVDLRSEHLAHRRMRRPCVRCARKRRVGPMPTDAC